MQSVIYDKPSDRVRAFIRDYAFQLYGIQDAEALGPLVEIAFDRSKADNVRVQAATQLAKYAEVPTRSIEYDNGRGGDDELVVEVIGEVAIGQDTNSEPVVSTPTPASLVELPNAGREEGGERVAPEGGQGLDGT